MDKISKNINNLVGKSQILTDEGFSLLDIIKYIKGDVKNG